MKTLNLNIISTIKEMYNVIVTSITLPGKDGSFTITPNHSYVVSTLSKGKIKYISEGGKTYILHIKGGFVELKDRIVSLCIDQEGM